MRPFSKTTRKPVSPRLARPRLGRPPFDMLYILWRPRGRPSYNPPNFRSTLAHPLPQRVQPSKSGRTITIVYGPVKFPAYSCRSVRSCRVCGSLDSPTCRGPLFRWVLLRVRNHFSFRGGPSSATIASLSPCKPLLVFFPLVSKQ